MTPSTRLHALATCLLLAAAAAPPACAPGDGGSPAERDWHGPPDDELDSVGLPTTCPASLQFYPVGGPHNGGWDSNATTFTCPTHPGSSPDNSDFIGGDHYGNDLFAVEGTPAIAPVSGTISHSGWGDVSGNRVTILDDCGWHYFSGHLETIAPGMSVGAWVNAGEVIGTVGDTGNAAGTQAHIHFSIYPESYNAGIDPFPLLQTVDGSACTGNGLQPGDVPNPPSNPCTDANVSVDDQNPAFAAVYGGPSLGFEQGGGSGAGFYVQQPYSSTVAYTVVRWGPDVPHTGLWELDAWIPETGLSLNGSVTYDIAFHGGHALKPVDQEAEKGGWAPLFPGQPFKFVAGARGYVGLSNLVGAMDSSGTIAFDALRWRYIGVEGGGGDGASCALSNDCAGTRICGPAGTCMQDCLAAGCPAGTCDVATGVCVLPVGEGPPLDDGSQFLDTDGDGIPNYLEGDGDSDGDGVINAWDQDSDDDGIDDSVEGSNDSDGDGIPDFLEQDSDGDGMSDADEVGSYPDQPLDSDLDGVPDFQDGDSDDDGIPDWIEVQDPADPADSDGDGTPDHRDTDADGDGIPDSTEAGWEPEEPLDSDGDGVPNYLDTDSDGDGLPDGWEGADNSDGDWLPDYIDGDSDGDGTPDSEDPDSDGNGIEDAVEMLDAEPGTPDYEEGGCACSAGAAGPRGGWGVLALLGLAGAARRRRGFSAPR